MRFSDATVLGALLLMGLTLGSAQADEGPKCPNVVRR